MPIPRDIQAELDKRDELILALEMLTVDQACRLLALESVVVNMAEAGKVKIDHVHERVSAESERFRQHFEGEGMSGFVERAQRLAGELVDPKGGKARAKTPAKKRSTKAKK